MGVGKVRGDKKMSMREAMLHHREMRGDGLRLVFARIRAAVRVENLQRRVHGVAGKQRTLSLGLVKGRSGQRAGPVRLGPEPLRW